MTVSFFSGMIRNLVEEINALIDDNEKLRKQLKHREMEKEPTL